MLALGARAEGDQKEDESEANDSLSKADVLRKLETKEYCYKTLRSQGIFLAKLFVRKCFPLVGNKVKTAEETFETNWWSARL